jgi:hypothetical protein
MALAFASFARSVKTQSINIPGSELIAMDPAEPDISGGGFAPNAVSETAAPHVTGVKLYGSAITGDTSTGASQTRWYRPFRHFYLLTSGYPVGHDCEIFLEVLQPNAGMSKVPLSFDENPGHWRLQRISLPAYPIGTKFRVVGRDNSRVTQGWVGFSAPFTLPKGGGETFPSQVQQVLLILFCMAAGLCALIGPGILLRFYFPAVTSSVWLPIPGTAMLAALGLLAWLGPFSLSPVVISVTGLWLICLVLTVFLIKRPLTSLLSKDETRVLGVIVLLIAIAVAKSSYSIGPSGELYGETISHTLEAGTRSDSRIPYHVVQLIALQQDPHSELAAKLFGGWSFSHRGPIAALVVAPIVLCADVEILPAMPDSTWTLFDPQGFAAYRISMMILASASLFIVYGLAKVLLGDRWDILAFLVVAAAPFAIHEIFFTWPKNLAASGVILAAYLVLRRRFFAAGLAVGAGYLCHPSALLCFPAILGMTLIVTGDKTTLFTNLRWRGRALFLTCAGLALWLAAWRLINWQHFEQGSFFQYFYDTAPFPLTIPNWLRSRLISLDMTLIPLNAFFFHRFDLEMLPYDRAPQAWVQFIHQYWSTLPFGVGFAFYPVLVWLSAVGFRRAKVWAWLVIAPPFALFVVYWGAGSTGLLREGLHGWVFGLLLFAVVIWKVHLSSSRRFSMLATAALAFRGLETIAMLIPFSAWQRGYVLQRPYQASDLLMLLIVISGVCLLTSIVISQCSAATGFPTSAPSPSEPNPPTAAP